MRTRRRRFWRHWLPILSAENPLCAAEHEANVPNPDLGSAFIRNSHLEGRFRKAVLTTDRATFHYGLYANACASRPAAPYQVHQRKDGDGNSHYIHGDFTLLCTVF